jgi:16S rRNA C967 or C1407 C5-methylase (RsmB/RsmF family)
MNEKIEENKNEKKRKIEKVEVDEKKNNEKKIEQVDEEINKKPKIEEKKYSQFLHNFFPPPHYRGFFNEEEELSWFTPYKTADRINENIFSILGHKNIENVIDGTASIGGNTLSFAQNKKIYKIVSVEINKKRFDCMNKNIELYKNSLLTIPKTYNDNFIEWSRKNIVNSRKYQSYLVFLDPPWGIYLF